MLDGCRDAKERWGGVHDLLDRWLHERHEENQLGGQPAGLNTR